MNNFLNANDLKKQVSIVALLSKLGHEPVPRHGKEIMYRSMLRDGDSTPSFSVNDNLGVWFDHGLGKGGNIIDFGLAYWKNLSFQEVVNKINEVCHSTTPPIKVETRPRAAVKIPAYKIEQFKAIGTHPAITSYLKSRGVFQVARNFLKEVYYFVEDDKGQRKHFFSAGWKNEQDGWEVRNVHFKGCIGHKGISFIEGHPKNVAVFEGFLDFLSWKFEHPEADHSIIVLNSLSILRAAVAKAKAFSSIDVYFDRDKQGREHTKELLKTLPYATDKSRLYEGHNDYNDKLKAALKAITAEANKPAFFAEVKVPFKR